ncbi:unnamed protein product [Nyctereutes procyonoides]|uniref:(raccoon dog) hypothetical protein n=1 Tax=Nyctereutes procyonoides TaxID=34880 RepID=A0A811YMQ5_NYCPR|nr:unnamed protein product [Nyctereutes procyonoides]
MSKLVFVLWLNSQRVREKGRSTHSSCCGLPTCEVLGAGPSVPGASLSLSLSLSLCLPQCLSCHCEELFSEGFRISVSHQSKSI